MKSLLLLVPLLLITSCRVGCVIEDNATTIISAGVATGLQCTNVKAVEEDVRAAVEKVGLCGEERKVMGPVCAVLAGILVNSLVNAAIPDDWGCTPDAAASSLTSLALKACASIPL